MVFQHFHLFPHMTRAGQRHRGAPPGARPDKAGGGGRGARAARHGSGWPTGRTPTRRSSPAARSSGWRSPGPWPCGPGSCSSTRSPPASTRSWWARSWTCCASWPPRRQGETTMLIVTHQMHFAARDRRPRGLPRERQDRRGRGPRGHLPGAERGSDARVFALGARAHEHRATDPPRRGKRDDERDERKRSASRVAGPQVRRDQRVLRGPLGDDRRQAAGGAWPKAGGSSWSARRCRRSRTAWRTC